MLVLIFLNVLEVSLYLTLELIKWTHGWLSLIAALLIGRCARHRILLVSLLHEHLDVPEVILKPIWRWLLQIDSEILE